MPIRVRIEGAAEAKQAIIGLPQKIARQALLQMAEVAHLSVKQGAGRHTKTGVLADSVFIRPTDSGGIAVGHDLTGETGAKHALFVIFGTRGHRVAPREKKALRWAGPGGQFFFSKGHWVSGYKGDDYMSIAAKDALDKLRDIISDISVFE